MAKAPYNDRETRRTFAAEYKRTGNLQEACNAAGIADRTGRKWLKDDTTVLAMLNDDTLNHGAIVVSIKPLITSDWISEQLQSIVTNDDTPPAAKVSALGQLAKMFGHDTAKNFIKFEGIANSHGERAKAIADSVAAGKLDTNSANDILSVIKQAQAISEVSTFDERLKALEVKHLHQRTS